MCFFNDTATTEIYTLSLHDALPISLGGVLGDQLERAADDPDVDVGDEAEALGHVEEDARRDELAVVGDHAQEDLVAGGVAPNRESTQLKSRHAHISHGGFLLKKKNK